MAETWVRCDTEGAVARIALARPDRRNALTREMLRTMTSLVREASASEGVRMILIEAEGPVFCAGMDLDEMQRAAATENTAAAWLEDANHYCELLLSILEAPQPTMAVVQGPALAGGVGIVLACDLVLAAEEAFFALPEPQRGITASVVMPLLAYRAGAGCAAYLLLSGRSAAAVQMRDWGVCHEVVRAEQLETATRDWIGSILSGSPAALAATKRQLRACAGAGLAEQLRKAARLSAESRGTADAREGLRAFLEKRKPSWHER